jgi:hypothetical protein
VKLISQVTAAAPAAAVVTKLQLAYISPCKKSGSPDLHIEESGKPLF